jgi:hypothetical protein
MELENYFHTESKIFDPLGMHIFYSYFRAIPC